MFGIFIVTGYTAPYNFRNLWSNDDDLRNEMVFNAMRRNRYEQILWSLHFESDLRPPTVIVDKFWKISPLTNRIKANMMNHFHAEQNLSYDESMIPYFGKHGCKQFIRGKPIRFGYKAWSLCTPSGYMVNFEIYQGKSTKGSTEYDRYGKCAAPLLSMIDDLPENIRDLPFEFYFDNLFTGFPLLMHLKDRGYNATGTIRENRIPKKCPLPLKADLKKEARGTFKSMKMVESDIRLTKWVDNSVVSIASTSLGAYPVSHVYRYSRAAQKRIIVERPCVIMEYNINMCGVDRFDQNVAAYRIAYKGKKWWSSIFTWLIDACLQNAWQLHRKIHPHMAQAQFRREVAIYYCKHYGVKPLSSSATASVKRRTEEGNVEHTLRYDRTDHLVVKIQNKRRCDGDNCKSIVRTACSKCNIGLCLPCFKPYHTFES